MSQHNKYFFKLPQDSPNLMNKNNLTEMKILLFILVLQICH